MPAPTYAHHHLLILSQPVGACSLGREELHDFLMAVRFVQVYRGDFRHKVQQHITSLPVPPWLTCPPPGSRASALWTFFFRCPSGIVTRQFYVPFRNHSQFYVLFWNHKSQVYVPLWNNKKSVLWNFLLFYPSCPVSIFFFFLFSFFSSSSSSSSSS